MDLANQGAIAAVERLGPTDSISVIAVDSSPHVVVPQSTVDAPDAIIAKIRRIESMGGGIFVGAALHAAADQLATAPQQNRHIVLFADAADAEEPTDYRTFVPALVQRGVTVSVIGLGTERDSDAQLLKEIATLGSGRCFFCADPSELPKVFAEETMQVARSTFSDQPTKIELRGELRALGDLALDAFPTAGGYSVAYARPEATVGGVTVDDARAPFFAFRQAGLGRSAAFLGEADGPASGGFATWDGYGTFFNTVVRWLGGSDAGGDVFADFVRDGHEAVLSVEVEAGKESALGKVVAKVAGPDGEAREVVLTRVGERRLEARVPMTGAGVYRAVVDAGENKPLRVAPLALPYSPEYATPPDPTSGERLLADLAAATLGRVDPPAAELFDGPRESQGFKDLASLCALLAVFVLLAEIAVRRLDVPFPTPRLPAPLRRRLDAWRAARVAARAATPAVASAAGGVGAEGSRAGGGSGGSPAAASPRTVDAPAPTASAPPAKPAGPQSLSDALAKAKSKAKRDRG
jgi:hypothetical protein